MSIKLLWGHGTDVLAPLPKGIIVENLKRILGMLDEGKRIYRIYEENEVQKDEFQYCQLMHQIVFGDKGFIETLGPTWNMIHDPRFITIENEFIVNRRAFFGGDARLGKQYINDDGTFTSTVADLEQYAEILGEGRNFHNVLVHPNEKCPVRKWLERIYTGFTVVKPHLSLKCVCLEDQIVDPATFKDAADDDIWALITQECPNRAFDKLGKPTAYGDLMFKLIRADIIGLIHDYAETPLIDSYIYLRDNGVVVATEDVHKLDPHGVDHQRVLQEIDILEQALTHRATLRVTAAKILKSLNFEQHLEGLTGDGEIELTDVERDELLRIVYESDWPEDKPKMVSQLLTFISTRSKRTFVERQEMHLAMGREKSQGVIENLKKGAIQSINHYTEPVLEIPTDSTESEVMRYSASYDSLTKNPLKAELFLVYVAAEQEGEVGVLDILSPIFDPNYELTEDAYFNFLRAVTHRVRSLRAMEAETVVPRGTKDTGTFVPNVDAHVKEAKLDIYGQRPNPDDPTKMQVKLADGTWRDTKFPDAQPEP